ncbi:MAG: cyclic pyranopterin monophosphate synthase MoaC [Candidatus Eremiobacteraeota bacterium]|nr:cyclic pyranopterin monophosphate synthase MoaC [Candidatus Eremiobacteraeota bacterium]
MQKPSHISSDGAVSMVDVSGKQISTRSAKAEARVRMTDEARTVLQGSMLQKGDAFVAAQLAGIMAAKQTANLIPLAHPLPLASIEVSLSWMPDGALQIRATARTSAQTGVEMEAMVAASVAALTVYDMTKAIDKAIVIESVRLLEKHGGKSGDWTAPV